MRMVLILIRRAARSAVGLALVAGILAPAACGGGSPSPSGRQVVAAFYPLAEVARRVGGARVRVSDLTPAGAEPHDIELSPDQVDRIQGAAVVVYLGHGFQPAVERAVRRSHARQLDALAGLPLEAPASNEEHLDADPHVWLDPVLFSTVVADVAGLLEQVDPAGRDVYAANASLYRADLAALDGRYRAGLARCRRQEIVTSHAAFGYLARRYGL